MYNTSSNKQVAYALGTLSDALFAKLAEKPLEKVSVSEVCALAGVTRRTYYRNCECLLDLVDYRIDLLQRAHLVTADLSNPDSAQLYRNFFSYWLSHASYLQVLLAQGLFERFNTRFVSSCVEGMDYALLDRFLEGREHQDVLRLYNNAFLVGGLGAMLRYWTNEGFVTPIEVLVEVLVALAPQL